MAAQVWYFANGPGFPYRTFSFQRPFTSRNAPAYSMDQAIQRSVTGWVTTTHFSGIQRITVRLEWDVSLSVTSGALNVVRRECVALINHLQRGGSIQLAEDSTKAYAQFCVTPPLTGNTKLTMYTKNIFPTAFGSGMLVDKELYIHSDSESSLCEMHSVKTDSAQSGNIELNDGVVYNFDRCDWALVREKGSYPALRLIPDKRNSVMLETENDSKWTLELDLEDDVNILYELSLLVGTLPQPGEPYFPPLPSPHPWTPTNGPGSGPWGTKA